MIARKVFVPNESELLIHWHRILRIHNVRPIYIVPEILECSLDQDCMSIIVHPVHLYIHELHLSFRHHNQCAGTSKCDR